MKTLKELEVVSMLGPCFGSIGLVLLAKHDSKLLAVKKLELERADAKDLKNIQNEIALAKQLCHPNLLNVENSFVTDLCLYIVSPAAGFGSCADLLANHFPTGFSEAAVAVVVRDVLQALSYLHSRMILHRAVRARHILITSSGHALLTCLRHAKKMSFQAPCYAFDESDAENLNWLSPEVLAQDTEGYDDKSDIYSVGMTVLELINGAAPYSDVSPTCMLVQKLSGWLPAFNQEVSPGLMQLRDACTRQNVQFRPSAPQLLNLPFLKTKVDLGNMLHPVIPLKPNQVQADSDDFKSVIYCQESGAYENFRWIFD